MNKRTVIRSFQLALCLLTVFTTVVPAQGLAQPRSVPPAEILTRHSPGPGVVSETASPAPVSSTAPNWISALQQGDAAGESISVACEPVESHNDDIAPHPVVAPPSEPSAVFPDVVPSLASTLVFTGTTSADATSPASRLTEVSASLTAIALKAPQETDPPTSAGEIIFATVTPDSVDAGRQAIFTVQAQNTGKVPWDPGIVGIAIDLIDQQGIIVDTAYGSDAIPFEEVQPGSSIEIEGFFQVPYEFEGVYQYQVRLVYNEEVLDIVGGDELMLSVNPAMPPLEIKESIPQAVIAGRAVDLVFAMDTSGSMNDEFSALCTKIDGVIQYLQDRGITVRYSILGIAANRECTTDYVSNLIPGARSDHVEDWGPATYDLSHGYNWAPGYVRMIIPMSDEGPENGVPCYDPGDDRDAITDAIAAAQANNVRVSPVLGSWWDPGEGPCITGLAQDLADGTGGLVFYSTDPSEDLADGIISLISAVVSRSWIEVSPASVPADGVSTVVVTATLGDADLNPLVGHRVRLISSRGPLDTFGSSTGTTDANGQFVTTLRSSTPGDARITAEDLSAGQTIAASAKVTFTPVPGQEELPPANEPAGAPRIISLQGDSELAGLYAVGIGRLDNTIRATIDWGDGVPGTVEFILNDQRVVKQATGSEVSHPFDFSTLNVGNNLLQVKACNDVECATETRSLYGWQVPDWLMLSLVSYVMKPDHIEIEFEVPSEVLGSGTAFQWLFPGNDTTMNTQVVVRVKLPLRGGRWEAEVGPEQTRNRHVPGRPKAFLPTMKFVGQRIDKLEGMIKLEGTVDQDGMHVDKAGVGFEAQLRPVPLFQVSVLIVLDAFPPGGTSVRVALEKIPPVREIALRVAKFEIAIKPRFGGNWDLQFGNDIALTGILKVGGDLEATLSVLNDAAKVRGGLGIDAQFQATTIEPNFRMEAAARGYAGYEVNLVLYTKKQEFSVDIARWCSAGCSSMTAQTLSPLVQLTPIAYTDWHVAGGGYKKPYAQFAAGQQFFGIKGSVGTTTETLLVSNVFTYSRPSLAVSTDGQAMMAWTHDDISKPIGQNYEIYASWWDGMTWQAPITVTADTYLDGNPRVAWAGGGNAVAVWERIDDPALPPTSTLDITTTRKVEIAASVWLSFTHTWSGPEYLTQNNALDRAPVLASSPDGRAMAAWVQNPNGDLGGTSDSPERIMASVWNGTQWMTPTMVVTDLVGLGPMSLAFSGTQALLAYTLPITPTSGLTATSQILTVEWDGVTWNAPVQRTAGDAPNYSPQAFFSSSGESAVVWLTNGRLTWKSLSSGEAYTTAVDIPANDFSLAKSPTGDLAVVWPRSRDASLVVFDQQYHLWSAPITLTNDISREVFLSPAFDPSGKLMMGYGKVAMSSQVVTATADTGNVVSFTVLIEGQTDLYVLHRQLVRNLTLTDADLAVSDDRPTPGSSVVFSATVHNSGDLALDSVAVGFYDGNPAGGGVLIGTSSLAASLAAGFTATLTMTYSVPITGGAHVLYAVADPDDLIAESNEADNTASLAAFGPDLELTDAGIVHWGGSEVGLATLIRNLGTTTASTATLAFYRDALTGTLALTDTVPSLAVGEAVTLTTPWDYGALAEGQYGLIAAVNPSQIDFTETITTNNTAELTLDVLPDLVVSPLYFWAAPLPDDRVAFTATVYNFGTITATGVPVEVYVDDPLTVTQRIFTTTIASLQPASYALITGTSQSRWPGEHDLYLWVNAAMTITETTWANNLASVDVSVVGQLVGTVTGDRPGGALEDALVEVISGTTTITSTTNVSGTYGPLPLVSGAYSVTVSAAGYLPDTQVVAMTAGMTTTHDVTLTLNAPGLGVSPASLSTAALFSETVTQTLTINNSGPAELVFAFLERYPEGITSVPLESRALTDRISANDPTAPNQVRTEQPIEYIISGVVDSFSAPDGTPRDLAFDGTYLWLVSDSGTIYKLNGTTGSVVEQYDAPGGSVPVGLTFDGTYLWHSDFGTDRIYKIDPRTSTPPNLNVVDSFPSPRNDPAGLAWDGEYLWCAILQSGPLIKIDPSTGAEVAQIPAPGSRSFSLTYLNGSLYVGDDGTDRIYRLHPGTGVVISSSPSPGSYPSGLANDSLQHLWVADWDTDWIYEIEVEISVDVPWLFEEPEAGRVAAYGSTPVAVGFDGRKVNQPGVYSAELVVASNDPVIPTQIVPVTINVTCPTCGRLTGAVSDVETGSPLTATVAVQDGPVMTAIGQYAMWLLPGVYTATASAEGYVPQTTQVTITTDVTLTQNFALIKDVPRMGVSPDSLSATAPYGEIVTHALTVSNDGPAPLDFRLRTGTGRDVSFFAASTELYGYDVSQAWLRVVGTQDDTHARVINLATGALIAENTDLDRYEIWDVYPSDWTYYKVEADRLVVGYESDFGGDHTTFIPSLESGSVGKEFIFYYYRSPYFYVYAVENATVNVYNTSGSLVASRTMSAGEYWNLSLSNAVYHVVSSGRIAMQVVGGNGYTTVPSVDGEGVGRRFYFATYAWHTGAFAVFAYKDADVNVYDLDSGSLLWTRHINRGDYWWQAGVGTRRLRLESTGNVEVWAGDTEGGSGIEHLGDDLSFAGGQDGREHYLHSLMDGSVIFAPFDNTEVNVDGTVYHLDKDEYLHLSGCCYFRHIQSSQPVLIQTLGRDSSWNDLGTYLGGVVARGSGESSWLTTDPVSGTVAAWSVQPITAIFDAGAVNQPGTYTTTLRVASNDPVTPTITVPVTMSVPPHPDMGNLRGTVSDCCTDDPVGATLFAQGGPYTFTTVSDPDTGLYSLWAFSGTYTVDVFAGEYVTETIPVTITAGTVVTQLLCLVRDAPVMELSPTSLTETLLVGEIATQTMTISNIGPMSLDYSLVILPEVGYTYLDSDSPIGPAFDWIEVTGGSTGPSGDDAYGGPYDVGFPFNFYGQTYSQFYVSTNGFLSFGDGSSDRYNTPLPDVKMPNNGIYALWDDLVAPSGSIRYQTFGTAPHRYLVVEFAGVYPLGTYDYQYFEVILYEGSNEIVLQYNQVPGAGDGRSASVGLENADGTKGLEYLYDGSPADNLLHNNLAIRMFQQVGTDQGGLCTTVSGQSEQTSGDLDDTYAYPHRLLGRIYLWAYSSDNDTLDAVVTAYNTDTDNWDTLYSGSGGTRELLDQEYDPMVYSQVRVQLDDTDNNDTIYYDYSFDWCSQYGDEFWMTVAPMTGTVPGYSAVPINVRFDATATPPDDYAAQLIVSSNDYLSPTVSVPVALRVNSRADEAWVVGDVTDVRTGEPLEATVTGQSGFAFRDTTDPRTGRYTLWLAEGGWTLEAAAPGYLTTTIPVTLTAGAVLDRDIALVRDAPVLAVTPTVLSAAPLFAQQVTRVLTICNEGPAPLNFEISKAAGGFTSTISADRLPAVLRELAGQVPLGGSTSVLLAVADTSYGNTVRNWLAAYPDLDPVDLFQARYGTPTLDELLAYDVVLVWGWSCYSDRYAMGDVLADYVDAGGRVVISVESWYNSSNCEILAGRFVSDGYSPFLTENNGNHYNWAYLGSYNASHPIMEGVTTVGAYRREYVSLDPKADWVASWDDGEEFIATKGNVVAINAYPGTDWNGDLQDIFHNSILYLKALSEADWLKTDPITGTVEAWNCQPVTVTFDASAVNQPGTYTATLEVESNDPLTPTATVGVTMTLACPTCGQLEGTVTDHRTGQPLEAMIFVQGPGYTLTVETDRDTGWYTLWGISGTHALTATSAGYVTQTATVPIVAGMVITRDFALLYDAPAMEVRPTLLTETLLVGEIATQTMTISNVGPLPLDFSLRTRQGGATTSVLIAAADSDASSFRSHLLAYPDLDPVDLFDARYGTPTLEQLQQYDVVLVWGDNCYSDRYAMGDVLADYLDAGGRVVVSVFNWYSEGSCHYLSGRFASGGYSPFVTENSGNHYSWASLGGYDASHPIMEGVTAVSAYYRDYVSLDAGAAWVASWDDGEEFIATKGNVVAINAHPVHNWSGDLPDLFHNSITYLTAGSEWLTTEPVTGTVPSFSAMPVTVTFEATSTPPDVYTATLHVTGNDPVTPTVNVPVTMTVNRRPDETLVVGTVTDAETGGPLEATVTGRGAFTFHDVTEPTTDTYRLYLAEGLWTVEAASEGYLTTTVEISLTMGVTYTLDFSLPLNIPRLAVAPRQLTATLPLGDVVTRTFTISNEGPAPLEFEIIGQRVSFFAASTELYGYDVSGGAWLRVIGTEDNTHARVIDLATGALIAENSDLDRYEIWDVYPSDWTYYKVEADKPVVGYETDFGGRHNTFIPSLESGPVGTEFIFYYYRHNYFYVFAVENTTVEVYNTSGGLVASRTMSAGEYWDLYLSNAVYHVVSSGRIAMETVSYYGYTTVPSTEGDGAGRRFYFATYYGYTGAFAVFAHEDADVSVYDLDSGSLLYSRHINQGNHWWQTGVGNRRLRLESTGDVEVWAGDTRNGYGIEYLGDDLSFAGGKNGREYYLHSLMDGSVIFAPFDNTQVNVDGTVYHLDKDEYLHLSGCCYFRHIHSSQPILIQTLGRDGSWYDMGTYLGGVVVGGSPAWLSSSPISGTIPGYGSIPVTVTLDAHQVPLADTYTADILVSSNDPVSPTITVAVTMTAEPCPNCGQLVGTVTDEETGEPLEATLWTDEVFVPTDPSTGDYWLWLKPGTYTITASAEGYLPTPPASVTIIAQTITTLDFPLTPDVPRVQVAPSSLSTNPVFGEVVTRALFITNTGTQPLAFWIREIKGQFVPLEVASPLAWAHTEQPAEGIDPLILEEMASSEDGQARFFVLLKEQADLSPAYAIEDWNERGQFVLNGLRETASRSQAGLLNYLDTQVQVGTVSEYRSHYIINALLVTAGEDVLYEIAARPEVAALRAERVYPVPEPMPGVEEATVDAVEWNIAQIRADDVWSDFSATGEGIVVANIDTGVRYTHDALEGQYRGNLGGGAFDHNYNWWDPDQYYNQPTDNNGHGSHTIGTMVGDDGGANQIGVAPAAKWIAAQGCDSYYCEDSDLISSAEWILAPWDLSGDRTKADPSKRPHVVNNSWGGGGCDTWYAPYVDAWRAAGIFPAFSAGNSGPGCSSMGSPGDLPQSFASGATDSSDTIADFSSRGPSCWGEIKPEVSAPGVNVRSAYRYDDSSYYTMNGTSMASPHSAGTVALLWSAYPGLIGDVDFTEEVIMGTAFGIADGQCGDPGPPNNVYGWGRIDAYEAVSQAEAEVVWLVEIPASDIVAPGEVLTVAVVFDSGLGQPGTDSAYLRVGTNARFTPHVLLPVTMTVALSPDTGRLEGRVTDLRSGDPLAAHLEVEAGYSPDTDPQTGLYSGWYISSTYTVTISAAGYLSRTAAITVTAGVTATQDFALLPNAPWVKVTPAVISETVPYTATVTRVLTISNEGPVATGFEIEEAEKQFTPASLRIGPFAEPTVLVPAEHQDAMSTEGLGLPPAPAGTPLAAGDVIQSWSSGRVAAWGIGYDGADRTVWVGSPVASWDGDGNDYEYRPNGTATGRVWPVNWGASYGPADMAFNWNTGKAWHLDVGGDECLHELDPANGFTGATICGPWTVSQRGVAYDPDTDTWYVGGWNEYIIYHIDSSGNLLDSAYVGLAISGLAYNPETQHLFVQVNDSNQLIYVLDASTPGYPQIGSFAISQGFAPYGGAGLEFDCDGNLWAVDQSNEMVYQFESGETASLCAFDVPWLSEEPITGTVSVYSSQLITVTLDATAVDDFGTYAATLSVETDDPLEPTEDVLVTMTVPVDPNMGKVQGTVTDARTDDPLEATLVTRGGTYTRTTDAETGLYGTWLISGTHTITVTSAGYLTHIAEVTVVARTTITQDFSLIPNAPWIDLSPLSIFEVVPYSSTATVPLTISNFGPVALTFNIREMKSAATGLVTTLDVEEGIDPLILEEMASSEDGQARFFVLLKEQADLSPAYGIEDWNERGQFVLDGLRGTARRSQAGLLNYLDTQVQMDRVTEYQSHYIINAVLVTAGEDILYEIAARPEVAALRAERVYPVPEPIPGTEEAKVDAVEWNIAQIRADDVWSEFSITGEGIVVANIDTGVRYTHDTLEGQYRGNLGGGAFDHNYNWWDPDMVYNQPTDNNGHGSHTMGTMVGDDGSANQIGVAPGAKWIAAQGCDSSSCSESDLISSAEWIVAPWDLTGNRGTADPSKRPHAVNNSWGGGGCNTWYAPYVDAWQAAGIFPAFSAGNSGSGCSSMGSPGDLPQSFASGATDSSDTIAYFSSRGPSCWGEIKPEVTAPGVNVRSAWSSCDTCYNSIGGTSMASPHSAAMIALLWSANPALIGDVDFTEEVIMGTAFGIADGQCGDPGPPNNVYGWGRIDAYEAVLEIAALDLVEWLSTEPITGTVAPYGSQVISVNLDAGLVTDPGIYLARLRVVSNDTLSPTVNVPVTMSVPMGPPPGPPSPPAGLVVTAKGRITTPVEVIGTDICLSWDEMAQAISYRVYTSTNRFAPWPGEWSLLATTTYTEYTHLGGGTDTGSLYYLVTALNDVGESDPSTMGAKMTLAFNYNTGKPNVNWIGLPPGSIYTRASDIVVAIEEGTGDGTNTKIDKVCLWDAANQVSICYGYSKFLKRWIGTDFAIEPGAGLYLNVTSDFRWTHTYLAPAPGVAAKMGTTIGFDHNLDKGNVNWISLPYDGIYTRASDVVADIEGEEGTSSRINKVMLWDAAHQVTVVYGYSEFLHRWIGTDFIIEPGDGIALNVTAGFTWAPKVGGVLP